MVITFDSYTTGSDQDSIENDRTLTKGDRIKTEEGRK